MTYLRKIYFSISLKYHFTSQTMPNKTKIFAQRTLNIILQYKLTSKFISIYYMYDNKTYMFSLNKFKNHKVIHNHAYPFFTLIMQLQKL